MNKLVSVVIPTYNREKSIARAIRSVLNQTYKNIEVIIVDDCSKDNTEDIVNNEFGNDKRVIFHKLEQNSGACVARNRGVQLSNGEYVAFLDSDDEFMPEKIEKQISCLQKTGKKLCASDYIIFNKDGSKGLVKTYPGSDDEVYKKLLYCNFITTGTLIGCRDCFIEVPFDESLPRYQDWDLVLRLCKKFSFCLLEEPTLLQYFQAVSITASTNHIKTLTALRTVYNKNKEGYMSDKLANSQIHWLMGLHSMFVEGQKNFRDIWIGATANGINLKRILVLFASYFGYLRPISRNL